MSLKPRLRLSPTAATALVLAWFGFIGLFFFPVWHPVKLLSNMLPVVPSDILAALLKLVSGGILPLGMLVAGVLAATGAGSILIKPFGLTLDRPQKITVSFGLGFAFFSYITFFSGVAGLYNSAGQALVIAVIALSAIPGALAAWDLVKGVAKGGRAGWWNVAFMLLLGVVSVFLLAKALMPAVFYDAVTYHLGVPNYYLQEGGIGYIPWDSYSNFPFMAEMVYTLGMFLSGLKLAQLTSVAMFVALALLVYEFTRSHVPDVPPALPAIFFLTTPAFMEVSVLYTNDLHLAYYSLMVVFCYFMLEKSGERGWLALMGVFTGICISTKYIALVSISVPAFMAVCYIAYKQRGQGVRHALATFAAFFIPAALLASPWLVKNLIYTGNPFYPAFYNLLGGEDMNAKLYAVHTMNHPSWVKGVEGIVVNPWRIFMAKPELVSANYGAAAYLGPSVILFLPVLVLVRDIDQVIKKLCIYAAVLFVLWCLAFPLTRFLYPAISALLIVLSYALVRFAGHASKANKAAVAACAGLSMVFGICLGFFLVDKWTDTYGFEHAAVTDAQYLDRRMHEGGSVMLHAVPVYEYINENTPTDSRVLIIGDAQHLYINRRHQYSYLSANEPIGIFSKMVGDNRAVHDYLVSQGITYIVYSPSEMYRLQDSGHISFAKKDDRYIVEFLKSGFVRQIKSSLVPGRPVNLFEVVEQ